MRGGWISLMDTVWEDRPMRRVAGNLLMALSVLLAAVAVLVMLLEMIQLLRRPLTEDRRIEALAGCLFTGVLVALGAAGFLTGRHLRRSSSLGTPEGTMPRPRRCLGPLIAYLAGSVAVGVFAGLAFILYITALGPLMLLIGQPAIFIQLFLGGMLGFKFDSGALSHAVIVAFNILYYVVFFYPLYSLLIMDRKVETSRCLRMKVLLGLFLGIHFTIGLTLAVLSRA
jgi:hypothetical protein